MKSAREDNATVATLGSIVRFPPHLAAAVTNDGDEYGAARWLLDIAVVHHKISRWEAFDMFWYDFEALDRVWPVFEWAADLHKAHHVLPALARFLCERFPVVWDHPRHKNIAPVTQAVSLADRVDTLVGLFSAGLKPNGSKDPFALRRAAKEVLQIICLPIQKEPSQ